MVYNYLADSPPGDFTVSLNVSNHISHNSTSRSYTLQRRVQALKLTTPDTSVTMNMTTDWKLDFGSLGSDTCYLLDLSDTEAGLLN